MRSNKNCVDDQKILLFWLCGSSSEVQLVVVHTVESDKTAGRVHLRPGDSQEQKTTERQERNKRSVSSLRSSSRRVERRRSFFMDPWSAFLPHCLPRDLLDDRKAMYHLLTALHYWHIEKAPTSDSCRFNNHHLFGIWERSNTDTELPHGRRDYP
jgi:hypothetical protein